MREQRRLRRLPDAKGDEATLCQIDPDGSVRKNFRTADQHRLKDKLHARITADEAAQLKAHLAADGYDTVQDWLTDVVRGYISKGDRE